MFSIIVEYNQVLIEGPGRIVHLVISHPLTGVRVEIRYPLMIVHVVIIHTLMIVGVVITYLTITEQAVIYAVLAAILATDNACHCSLY